AQGTLDYKYFEVPTHFTEDKYVVGYEVRAGDPRVVHHVIVYAKMPPPARPSFRRNIVPREPEFTFAPGMEQPEGIHGSGHETHNDRPAPRGGSVSYVAILVPGQGVRTYADGTAIRIRAGATLVFQVHYTACGRATADRTRIGFKFAKQKPT